MKMKIQSLIDEQIQIRFTGKINILRSGNHQFLGHIIFFEGDILDASFEQVFGFKALGRIILRENEKHDFDYVVEPELVDKYNKKIHYPYSILKTKLSEILENSEVVAKLRPPEEAKLLIDPKILSTKEHITSDEFEILISLVDWSLVRDLYSHCPLSDHEITTSLISLRKKGALRLIAKRQG